MWMPFVLDAGRQTPTNKAPVRLSCQENKIPMVHRRSRSGGPFRFLQSLQLSVDVHGGPGPNQTSPPTPILPSRRLSFKFVFAVYVLDSLSSVVLCFHCLLALPADSPTFLQQLSFSTGTITRSRNVSTYTKTKRSHTRHLPSMATLEF